MDREGSKKAIGGFILRFAARGLVPSEPLCEGSSSQNHSHSLSPSTGVTGVEEKRVVVNVHPSLVDCA